MQCSPVTGLKLIALAVKFKFQCLCSRAFDRLARSISMDNDTILEALSCPKALDQFNTTEAFSQLLVPPSIGAVSDYWFDKTPAWKAFFYIMLVVFLILFLALAIFCLLMLAKRHLAQRFKVRTFIAIDVALMILGFSRAFFILLDPWGQSGFCIHKACVVFSRLSGALAFPSLTASYTLVFLTLWMSARIQVGRSSYQKFKILAPLCFVHYCVAILFEIVGLIPWPSNTEVVMYLLIACEALFSVWGFIVCFAYLFAGNRLLHSIEKSARNSSRICHDSPNLTRQQLIEKSKFQNQKVKARTSSNLKLKDMVREHHRRAIRKVSIIMYLTVILGMLYSVLSLANLVVVILTIFDGCPGFIAGLQKQDPGVWLLIRYIFFILEFLLAVLLTYSITDYRPVLIALKGTLSKCCIISSGDASAESTKHSPTMASSSVNTLSPNTPTKPAGSPKLHVSFTFEESKPENKKEADDKDSLSPSVTPEPITYSGGSVLRQTHSPSTPSPLTTNTSTINSSNGVS